MPRLALLAALLCALSPPALGQDVEVPLPDPETVGDDWTIAGGAGWAPDYVGSNDYRLIPVAAIRGKVGPVAITSRGTYLYADLFERGTGLDLDAGPIVGLRSNRTGKIEDDVVDRLPELNRAIEVGGFAGVSLHNVTNPYDSLSFSLDVLHDIGNAHESTVLRPNIDFSTPLSRRTFVSADVGAEFVSNRFADYYFGIDAAGRLASGLPVYNPDGGMKSWNAGLLVGQAITGDLTGGLSLFGTADYSRLVGDFKRSPIVSRRGSPSQWLLAAGLAYTF